MSIRRAAPFVRRLRQHRLLACLALIAVLLPTQPLLAAPPADGLVVRGIDLAAVVPVESPRSVTFELAGAQGQGTDGGKGAVLQATASLMPGASVTVRVGGNGGYNGGGPPPPNLRRGNGASAGGGASDLRIDGDALADRILVAAGGGGGISGAPGGFGAATGVGGSGSSDVPSMPEVGGQGGTPTSGGVGFARCADDADGRSGSFGTGGMGGFANFHPRKGTQGAGGGGGGGWFGGAGGDFCYASNKDRWPFAFAGVGGGGGGSSFVDPTIFPSGAESALDGANIGNGWVRVSLDCGATWSTSFPYTGSPETYTVPAGATDPTIDLVTPTAGPVADGNVVTITGTNLDATTAVMFGDVAATSFTVDSATQITATAPALGAGPHDLSIATTGCDTTRLDAFRAYSTPSLASISPNTGPTDGGDTVVLTGTNLAEVDKVLFGSTPALSFVVDSDTQITAVTPAADAGSAAVSVSSPDIDGSSEADYTFVDDAEVTPPDEPVPPDEPPLTDDPPLAPAEPASIKIVDNNSEFQAGNAVEMSGSGFASETPIDIVMYSTPRHLTTVTSDVDGNFTAQVAIPADAEVGAHELVAIGLDTDGHEQVVGVDIEVLGETVTAPTEAAAADAPAAAQASPGPTPAELAFTGPTSAPFALIGLGILLLGMVMVLIERHRNRRTATPLL